MQGKLDTETMLSRSGVPYTSIRPVYIYGPLNYNPVEEVCGLVSMLSLPAQGLCALQDAAPLVDFAVDPVCDMLCACGAVAHTHLADSTWDRLAATHGWNMTCTLCNP